MRAKTVSEKNVRWDDWSDATINLHITEHEKDEWQNWQAMFSTSILIVLEWTSTILAMGHMILYLTLTDLEDAF